MKKLLAVLLSIVSIICLFCAFAGCGGEEIEIGTLYTVTQAFEKGFLKREQVMSIAYYRNGGIVGNEEIMGENYSPLPKSPEELSAKTQKTLKWAFNHMDTNNYSDSEVEIIFYGTYNGCVAVMNNAFVCTGAEWTEKVADVNINYNSGNRIYVWRKN